MKITIMHSFYDFTINGYDIPDNCCLANMLEYIRDLCGGMVWCEIETTDQPLPKYARYVDTFYNINVYYDRITDMFLFEDFN